MANGNASQICLCAEPSAESGLRQILEQAGFRVGFHPFQTANGDDFRPYHLIMVEGTGSSSAALKHCNSIHVNLGESFVPILYVTDDAQPTTRLASLECGADAYLLRPFEPKELLAQANALMRIKERHDRLTEKTEEVHRINKSLQSAYQQIDYELELAGRIQTSFLPQQLPHLPQVRFAVHYRPCGRVGGDFYDVFRLDESHLGLYVADAMGHGVPAGLLTIFVKKGIRAKEINGNQYRLLPPGEVLDQLNRDLIEQELSDQPFITMVYALFNFREGGIAFSRSGHPHPIYLPRAGPPQLWRINGALLGVFDTEYPVARHQLQPGDRLVLYSDGIDRAAYADEAYGVPSLLRCLEENRCLPLQEMLDKIAAELVAVEEQRDDLTLLALEIAL